MCPSAFPELGDLDTLRELLYLHAHSSGVQSHGQFNLGLLGLSPQGGILSRDARVERKTYTVKDSAHKAPGGEPRQGKTDVQGWCFPGQRVQGPFLVL